MAQKFLLLKYVLLRSHGLGTQPEAYHLDNRQPGEAFCEARRILEDRLQQTERRIAWQRVWDESLEVIGDRDRLERAWHGHHQGLPAEHEEQSDQQRPLEPRAQHRKERAVDRQPQ